MSLLETITASTPARSSSTTSSRLAPRELCDRELSRRNVGEKLEQALEERLSILGRLGREQEDLGVDELEHLLEVVLVAHAKDALETAVVHGGDHVLERVLVGAVDHDRIDAPELVGPAVAENGQRGHPANRPRVRMHDEALGALILCHLGGHGVGHLHEHGDAVALRDRLTQPS